MVPRVNIQAGRNGLAKTYQVRQVLAAIDKLAESVEDETNGDAANGEAGRRDEDDGQA